MSVETPPVEAIAAPPSARMARKADRPAAVLFSRIVTVLCHALSARRHPGDRNYLRLRIDREPSRLPQRDSVRAELAAIGSTEGAQ